MRLNWIRHAPLESGVRRVAVLAERRDHRLLAFLHDEEAAAQPDQRHHAGDETGALRFTALTCFIGIMLALAAVFLTIARPRRRAEVKTGDAQTLDARRTADGWVIEL